MIFRGGAAGGCKSIAARLSAACLEVSTCRRIVLTQTIKRTN